MQGLSFDTWETVEKYWCNRLRRFLSDIWFPSLILRVMIWARFGQRSQLHVCHCTGNENLGKSRKIIFNVTFDHFWCERHFCDVGTLPKTKLSNQVKIDQIPDTHGNSARVCKRAIDLKVSRFSNNIDWSIPSSNHALLRYYLLPYVDVIVQLFLKYLKICLHRQKIRHCEIRPILCFVVSQNSKQSQLQNFRMYQKYRKNNCKTEVHFEAKNECFEVKKLCFKVKNICFEAKNVCFKVKNVPRTFKRRPVLCFLVLQKSKHSQLQNFWMYQKYCIKIVSKISWNTCSYSNFNRIYNYNYGNQGLSKK